MAKRPSADELQPICTCGHGWDEHAIGGQECLAEYDGHPCDCFLFEDAANEY